VLNMGLCRTVCSVIFALFLAGSALATECPELRIEAPDSLALAAARVRSFDRTRLVSAMRLVGLEAPGPPIRVILAPEGSDAARTAPEWATGYAYGQAGIVVMIPSRTYAYPYGSLEALLHHEVAHVLIARAAGGHPVPRWFNEGLAMAAARTWDFEDRTRLVLELLPGVRVNFMEVDSLFEQGQGQVNRAYALSGAFVRDLLQRQGIDFPARVLSLVRQGASFEGAFSRAAGMSLKVAEASFFRRQNIWNRWVPFLTSSLTLWMGITLLALYAVKKRRQKDARKKKDWEAEEETIDPPNFDIN